MDVLNFEQLILSSTKQQVLLQSTRHVTVSNHRDRTSLSFYCTFLSAPRQSSLSVSNISGMSHRRQR